MVGERRLRILYASDVSPDPDSGAAGTDLQTIRALELYGHSVDTLWWEDFSHRITHPALHSLVELPRTMRRAISAACSREHYDVVIANQPYAYLAARRIHAGLRRPLVVIRSHGFEAHMNRVLAGWQRVLGIRSRARWKVPLGALLDRGVSGACKQAARYADGMLVNSRADKIFIETNYHLAAHRVARIAQAPPPGFLAAPVEPLSARRLNRLVFIGPLQFHKGIDVMVPAMREVLNRYPETTFTWVCPATDLDSIGRLFSGLAPERLSLLPYGSQAELMGVLDSCGIFVFSSFFEGFGKVPLEAMARGLCVVSTSVGGIADIIETGKDGVLVPPGDASVLVAEIGKLLADQDKAILMGRSARATASKYSWERAGREISGWLSNLDRRSID